MQQFAYWPLLVGYKLFFGKLLLALSIKVKNILSNMMLAL
jgi:hypothetical protein